MAICVKSDRALLADSSRKATHIARDGAISRGIVTLASQGVVYLKDWTLASGSKYLTVGAVYYVGANGAIVANGSGQAIGQAISVSELSVQIWTQEPASTEATTTENYTVIDGTTIIDGYGSPSSYTGEQGNYYKDIEKNLLYGPKGMVGSYGTVLWGSPIGQRADAVFLTQYFVADLPTPASEYAFSMAAAINGRKPGEGAGAGTGVMVWCDGLSWYSVMDALPVTE